ncbi:CPBP family intramembrane glutamic endopeptidase [Fervidibacillus halotolerans]|uniref:CPBP family intramembrane metalloprotease n=1 Tax=Fervidibacillus halotolerans TaxID=2980027 RepID=A0A9E8M0P3_9BACI|nr:CPBP family intramembrane glutamic endopeptidase [Fervidibacillus halotolerans]WAA13212.1 CPBP family intramembrane metalloprotease [Fervidibacillus halotolerans]
MKKVQLDWKIIIGIIIAHILLFFTFDQSKVFWYILTGTTLFLISYTIMNEDLDDQLSVLSYLFFGFISGLFLYSLFWAGNSLFDLLNWSSLQNQVVSLYEKFSPDSIWHYIVLVLVIIPGEEIFWRGFILKRLSKYMANWTSILLSSVLYASVYIYSGYFVLVLAAVISGLIWGLLYVWKRSIPLVIISHLTFDLLLFVFLPLI